jgi:hypothetical protein
VKEEVSEESYKMESIYDRKQLEWVQTLREALDCVEFDGHPSDLDNNQRNHGCRLATWQRHIYRLPTPSDWE